MDKKENKKKDKCFESCTDDCNCVSRLSCDKASGSLYGLGVIGAAVYYISTATGFWVGVLGVLKALVWPAFVVYELMKYLGM